MIIYLIFVNYSYGDDARKKACFQILNVFWYLINSEMLNNFNL